MESFSMRKIALLIIAFALPSFAFAGVDCEQKPDHPKCQPDAGGGPKAKTVPLAQTGQTTSYVPGDDGDLEMGVPWPSPRFTDNSDGTQIDNLTGLRWTSDGSFYSNWYNATQYCNSYSLDGLDDWRLPNFKELLSVVDFGQDAPVLPLGHFFTKIAGQSGGQDYYWSSTTDPHFDSGNDSKIISLYTSEMRFWPKTGGGYSLCVRGGW
jgi:hypothetical protein